MARVRGDDSPCQVQHGQQLQYDADPVSALGRRALPEHRPRVADPGAQQMRGRDQTRMVEQARSRLAVERDKAIRRHCVGTTRDERWKAVGNAAGRSGGTVARRCRGGQCRPSVAQLDVTTARWPSRTLHYSRSLGATIRRRYRHEHNVNKLAPRIFGHDIISSPKHRSKRPI